MTKLSLKLKSHSLHTHFHHSFFCHSVDDAFPNVTFHFATSLTLKVYPHDYLFPFVSSRPAFYVFYHFFPGTWLHRLYLCLIGVPGFPSQSVKDRDIFFRTKHRKRNLLYHPRKLLMMIFHDEVSMLRIYMLCFLSNSRGKLTVVNEVRLTNLYHNSWISYL